MRFLKSAWVGTVSVGVLACGSPAAPTNAVAPDFIVATGMNVVPIGSTTRFTVTAFTHSSSPNSYFTGVQTADVSGSATWSSDNPAVVAVTSRNLVGRAAGTANVTASYMGSEYTIAMSVVAPSVSAQRFVGTWSGAAKSFCKDLIGRTRSCDFIPSEPSVAAGYVSLSLANAGDVLQGSVEFGNRQSPTTGPVVGGVNASGELIVGGTPLLYDGTPVQLRDWHFVSSGTQLVGSGMTDMAWVNIYGPVLMRVTYTEISTSLSNEHQRTHPFYT